ncbi:Maf-like protein [Vibrio ichthyoenteri ATCC 700023]|uniref:7-methyl-GTP pyrophosphatase n=1 Tax=Vibrio ichthyoenteri ATCC 700023 TaxID=870968 RepID=F9S6E4_9VIBR|nr:nucleoside triphosphate pyrophosphatase [Vibrio ichthyoenteri]EGU33291.1 Maf-like protein [Vibrio ichthyoenteri ATCC 700023]
MPNYQLVLASTSPFRQQLLKKLAIPFKTVHPSFDETPLKDESPSALVLRLAQGKAQSCPTDVTHSETASLVIGSDQVCVIDGEIIGKPHTRERAIEQLQRQSGKSITFYTGLALHNTHTNETSLKLDTFIVHFRSLTTAQIESYIDKEQPFFCAGSFKSEGLGIALFERLEGKDPNTLVGLPLIDLIDMLEAQGFAVL